MANSSDIIYPGAIESVNLYLLGESDYVSQSHAAITVATPYSNNIPVINGPNSLLLGTTDIGMYCKTCHNSKQYCPTHFGHITLKYPVQIAIDKNIMIHWLKIICFKCGSLMMDRTLDHVPPANRLGEAVKITRDTVKKCTKCSSVNPVVNYDKLIPTDIWMEYPSESGIPEKKRLYNHKIVEIFERVTNETVAQLGKPPTSHPRRFLYYTVPCAPIGVRPNVIVNGRPNSNDATTITKTLIATNMKLPNIIPEPDDITPALSRLLTNLDLVYRTLVRGSEGGGTSTNPKFQILSNTDRNLTGFLERLPKKTGDIRWRNLGVKTDNMGRFVICCGTRTEIREFGIPQSMAEGLTTPLAIREDNREWGMTLLMNAKTSTYPHIKKIYRPSTGMTMLASSFADRGNVLEIGDVVYRQLMNGDPMTFNRQPSLKRESFNTHFIKIYNQFVGEHNVSVCKLYNSDFDGDAMNMVQCMSQKAVSEQLFLNGIDGTFVSTQDATPSFGIFQDTLIQIALITRDGERFSRHDAMKLLRNLPVHMMSKIVLDKEWYTGRDLVSLLMLPINYKGRANYYNEGFAPFLPYNINDINVVINRGQIISGIIDKKTAGQGVMGSIFHKMCNQFGPNDTLDSIYSMQHLGHEWSYDNGVTFNLTDISISPHMKPLVRQRIDKIMADADAVAQKVERGELIPPVGKTVDEYYEELLLTGILKHGDDFREPVLRSITFENNYWRMAMHGGKGKYLNIQQVLAVIGQQNIKSYDTIRNFGVGRTSSHFQRYDNSPIANGYVPTSYAEGIGPKELLHPAREARQAIVNIALTTSKTGHSNRELCCNLQSNITNALRQTVKNQTMVQPLYGEIGGDPSKMVTVQFPTVMISDAEFKDGWYDTATEWGNINQAKLQIMLNEEFDAIRNDRDKYRQNYIALDYMSDDAYVFSNKLSVLVDVRGIVGDILFDSREHKHDTASPVWLIPTVKKFCEDLPYAYTNHIQMAQQTQHAEIHVHACFPICMLIRTYLCSKRVRVRSMSKEMIELMLDKIFQTLVFSLVGHGICVGLNAGQSFSEPSTQNMLDSHHRAGASSGTVDPLTKLGELTNAKATDRMSMPMMKLEVREEFQHDMSIVQNIANLIEVMRFSVFIKPTYNILYESFNKPTYPEFANDAKMMSDFSKNNPTLRPPNNLINWCIRFELDIDIMITKNIDMGTIIYALNANFPDLYIVHSNEFDTDVVVRCYFSNTLFVRTKYVDDDDMDDIAQKIINTVIRGVPNIISTVVESRSTTTVNDSGAIESKQTYYIRTRGTNLARILDLTKYFQVEKCQTDSMHETEEVWGIEAARHKIMCEFISLIDGQIMPQHLRMFSDEMCAHGKIIGLVGDASMAKRERHNILLRIAYSAPKRNMTLAAYNGLKCPIYGISGPLLTGQIPKIGPNWYEYSVDEEFTTKHVMSSTDLIDAL